MARSHHEDEDGAQRAQEPPHRPSVLEREENRSTLRIWELDNLREIASWTTEQQEAALFLLKRMYGDYEELADSYNNQQEKIEELTDGVSQLQEEVTILTDRVQVGKESVRQKQSIITYLEQRGVREGTPGSSVSYTQVNKSIKFPDPPVFTDGTDPQFEDWLLKTRTKLENNADHFSTEKMQMGYVQSRVGGIALKHLAARFRPDSTAAFTSTAEIFEALERIYGDPDRRRTATEAFRKLYQGSKTFNDFWADFQRYTSEMDITEESKIDELRHKVSFKIQSALVSELNPASVYDLARKCQFIDQNLRSLQAQEARVTKTQRLGSNEKSTGQQLRTTVQENNTNPSYGQQKLFIDPQARNQNLNPNRKKEVNQLRREGRCFTCKEVGHRSFECPQKTATVQVLEDEPQNNESGKE